MWFSTFLHYIYMFISINTTTLTATSTITTTIDFSSTYQPTINTHVCIDMELSIEK